mmetsp:Transcript_2903/g.11802  ORF Transcript_2903/g.11802 Transcript_2903/m.11802 type:complete len:218 (+) Transcript_2903:3083-3736(+)
MWSAALRASSARSLATVAWPYMMARAQEDATTTEAIHVAYTVSSREAMMLSRQSAEVQPCGQWSKRLAISATLPNVVRQLPWPLWPWARKMTMATLGATMPTARATSCAKKVAEAGVQEGRQNSPAANSVDASDWPEDVYSPEMLVPLAVLTALRLRARLAPACKVPPATKSVASATVAPGVLLAVDAGETELRRVWLSWSRVATTNMAVTDAIVAQ